MQSIEDIAQREIAHLDELERIYGSCEGTVIRNKFERGVASMKWKGYGRYVRIWGNDVL